MNDAVKIGSYMTAHPRAMVWLLRDGHGQTVGVVKWNKPWRQYVLSPESSAVFSHDCLTALAAFVKGLSK